jgi:hypothetical protein
MHFLVIDPPQGRPFGGGGGYHFSEREVNLFNQSKKKVIA